MINDPEQAAIAVHHIDQAMDALHKMNWAGSQFPMNKAWDDLINAKIRIGELRDACQTQAQAKSS